MTYRSDLAGRISYAFHHHSVDIASCFLAIAIPGGLLLMNILP